MNTKKIIKAVVVSFIVMVMGTANVSADSLTAEQIMEQSGKVMGVAAHYRIVTQGMEISIFQKPLPDGSLAMLTDISAPIQRTTIMYGDNSYDLYLEQRIAVDTSVLRTEVKSTPGVSQLLSTIQDTGATLNLTRTFTDNGREYHEIEQAMPITEELLANLPPQMAQSIPAKTRFIVDAETFLIHAKETISSNGTRIAKLQFLGFEPMPDLTDDIFQVPEGFEILSPKSIHEYATLTRSILAPKPEIQRLPPIVSRNNRRVASDEEIYLPPGQARKRTVLMVVNVIVIAMIVTFFLWRHWRKKKG